MGKKKANHEHRVVAGVSSTIPITSSASTTGPTQDWRDTFINVATFPYYYPKISLIALLMLSGGIAYHMLTPSHEHSNDFDFNDLDFKMRAENCRSHFAIAHGNPFEADVVIYAGNHHSKTNNKATVDCIQTFSPKEVTVLVESVRSGVKVACKDHLELPAEAPSTFNPVCIGADVESATYYKTLSQKIQYDFTTRTIRKIHEIVVQSKLNSQQLFILLDGTIAQYQEEQKMLEHKHGFSSINIETPTDFSDEEVTYQTNVAVLPHLQKMRSQLQENKNVQEVFADYLPRFAQPNYFDGNLEYISDEKGFANGMLQRNMALVDAIARYAKPGEKTAVPIGLGHVVPLDSDAGPAVRYLWNAMNKPEMRNRFAVLTALDDKMPVQEKFVSKTRKKGP